MQEEVCMTSPRKLCSRKVYRLEEQLTYELLSLAIFIQYLEVLSFLTNIFIDLCVYLIRLQRCVHLSGNCSKAKENVICVANISLKDQKKQANIVLTLYVKNFVYTFKSFLLKMTHAHCKILKNQQSTKKIIKVT